MGAKTRFFVVFCVLVAAFYASLESELVSRSVFPPLHAVTARLAAGGLSLARHDVSAVEGSILCRNGQLAVGAGCDALEPSVLLIAAVVAFPATAAAKLAGVLVGAAFVFVLNLARVMTLVLAFDSDAETFRTLHVLVWPATFMAVTLAAWVSWAAWARRRASPCS